MVISTNFWLKLPKCVWLQFWRLIYSLLLIKVREHCKYSTYNCSNSYYNWKNHWNDFCFHWGGSTTPQNGEVKALSVSVPWLDVLHSLPNRYFRKTDLKLGDAAWIKALPLLIIIYYLQHVNKSITDVKIILSNIKTDL